MCPSPVDHEAAARAVDAHSESNLEYLRMNSRLLKEPTTEILMYRSADDPRAARFPARVQPLPVAVGKVLVRIAVVSSGAVPRGVQRRRHLLAFRFRAAIYDPALAAVAHGHEPSDGSVVFRLLFAYGVSGWDYFRNTLAAGGSLCIYLYLVRLQLH